MMVINFIHMKLEYADSCHIEALKILSRVQPVPNASRVHNLCFFFHNTMEFITMDTLVIDQPWPS